jgi:outer membrane protein OmpA-like peptidoglycan-associated protein
MPLAALGDTVYIFATAKEIAMGSKLFLRGAAIAVLVTAPVAFAQDVGLILRDGQVNETALLEALSPPTVGRTKSPIMSMVDRKPVAHMLVTFETNSAELTAEARKMLDGLGHVMQAERLSSQKFTIEGHADPRGGEQFNLELSQRRAEAAVAYLSQVHGIDPSRLEAVGKGQTELLKPDQPFAPENRRVTVKTKLPQQQR